MPGIVHVTVQCMTIELLGKPVKCASGGTVRGFLYDEQDPIGPKRTHQDTLVHAQRAMAQNKNVSLMSVCTLN